MTASSPSSASDPRLPFRLRVASTDLAVRRVRGVEELSHPYRFDVECMQGDETRDARDLLGAAATLTLVGVRGVERVVRGVVSRVRAGARGGRASATLRIVPRAWALDRGRRSRIFQDKSVPEIIRQVLGEASIDCEVLTTRAYTPRTYCVQYQESDLAFVSRIAAEEGLFYFFRQPSPSSGDKEMIVFGDAAAHFEPIAGDRKLPIQHGSALVTSEHVHTLTSTDRVRSGKTLVRAYDHERPQYDLRGEGKSSSRGALDETELQTYRHDADALEGVDDGVAGRLLDAVRRRASTAEGTSTCPALSAGLTFDVAGHVVDALNASYALVRVEHDGTQPIDAGDVASGGARYENRFECVAAEAPWRPKKPVRRLQQATETAVVVGPPGEEIYVDAEGRVKVQFPWDLEGKQNEKSSCWLRTMQPWAGASWGVQFIPRVGMEVVVLFVGGDIDRPLISGAVPNAVNPFPFPLPEAKTQSGIRTRSSPGGAGSNELRFDDAAGAEQIYLHAQKNLDEVIEADHTRTVKKGETIDVAADRQLSIGGSQKRTVAAADEVDVGQNRTLRVAGDHVRVIEGNELVEIGKNLIIHVKGQQILKIGGEGSSGGESSDFAPPKPPTEKAPKLAAAAMPSAPEAKASATLLWSVEELPEDLYPQGAALIELAEQLEPTLVALQREAIGLRDLVASAPLALAPRLGRSADALLGRVPELRAALAQAEEQADKSPPELAAVRSAFSDLMAGNIRRIAAAEEAARTASSAARERAAAAAGSGSATGGGGFPDGDPKWTTNDKDAHLLDITGKATIASTDQLNLLSDTMVQLHVDQDGLRIMPGSMLLKVGDTSITLTKDSIVLAVGASNITMEKASIVLQSPTMQVVGYNDGLVFSSGLLKLVGGPISLND